MSSQPRIAIIGCGYWGAKHVRVFQEIPSACLALAVDQRQEQLDHIRARYAGVEVSQSFETALSDDIDGVVIATPISTHYTLARQALLAGKHVLVEKPLATSSAECRDLIELAKRQGRVLMAGHTFQYNPAVIYLRDLVRSGELGVLYYIDCARLNLGLFQHDADVVWDLAPHDLSIIFFLLGQTAQTIRAWGHAHVLPDIADMAFADLTFENGLNAHIHVSWLDPCKVRRVSIVGSKKMVVYNDMARSEKVRIYDQRFTTAPVGDDFADFQAGYHYGNQVRPFIKNAEPLRLECQDFVRAIATGAPVRADGYAGLRVVEALEAASRSLANHGQAEPLTNPESSTPTMSTPALQSNALLEDEYATS